VSLSLLLVVSALLSVSAVGLLLCGCGGSEVDQYVSTISGSVVDASAPSIPIPGARLVARGLTTAQATADDSGHFSVTVGVDAEGPTTVTLTVSLPEGSPYQGLTITIETSAGAQVTITITLIPLSGPIPAEIEVTPPRVSMEAGQNQQFVAGISDAAGQPISGYTPACVVEGQIGAITAQGLFTASLPKGVSSASGKVWAVLGAVSDSADVTVHEPGAAGDLDVTVQ